MEESKDSQATTTPVPLALTSSQATAPDVVMEENITPSLNNNNNNNNNTTEKDSKVIDPDTGTVNNQKIVEEFQYLLEKSQQLFAGLR